MWEAMEMGCDIAGGMPAAEWLPELARKHVDLVFEIAEKYNVPIDMHIDQSKDMFDRSLEYTAWLTLQKGWGPASPAATAPRSPTRTSLTRSRL